jgi:hypothetical protein
LKLAVFYGNISEQKRREILKQRNLGGLLHAFKTPALFCPTKTAKSGQSSACLQNTRTSPWP